jgi:hypothetical protein
LDPFVEKCRKEWKRLGVPDAVANEMASDLEADLREADSEGTTREEVLGDGVFDPRTFAESWASERGVVGPAPSRPSAPWRSPMLVAVVAFAIVAAVGLGLVLGSRVAPSAAAAFPGPPPFSERICSVPARPYPAPPWPSTAPTQIKRRVTVRGGERRVTGPGCSFAQVGPAPNPPFAQGVPLPIARVVFRAPSPAGNRAGWVLFIVGIGGIVVVALMRWVIPGPWSRRPQTA